MTSAERWERIAGRVVWSRLSTRSSRRNRIAVSAAVLAPAILVSGWSTAAALQGGDYDPMQQTVSVLAGRSARYPWVMAGAIFFVALCQATVAVGLRPLPRQARIGLIIEGLTAIGIAFFPVHPHGSSLGHTIFTAVGGLTIAVWPALAYFPSAGYPRIVSKPVALGTTGVLLAILLWVLVETQRGPLLGLAERLELFLATAWPSVVAIAVSRTATSRARFAADAEADRPKRLSEPGRMMCECPYLK